MLENENAGSQRWVILKNVVNWQSTNKQLPLGQKGKCLRWQKTAAKHKKNAKLFLWEEGSLGVRPNRRKGFQLHLTENVLEDILPS